MMFRLEEDVVNLKNHGYKLRLISYVEGKVYAFGDERAPHNWAIYDIDNDALKFVELPQQPHLFMHPKKAIIMEKNAHEFCVIQYKLHALHDHVHGREPSEGKKWFGKLLAQERIPVEEVNKIYDRLEWPVPTLKSAPPQAQRIIEGFMVSQSDGNKMLQDLKLDYTLDQVKITRRHGKGWTFSGPNVNDFDGLLNACCQQRSE